jgi:hypothetical protein
MAGSSRMRRRRVELRAGEGDALEEYGRYYHRLLGDERTRRTFNAILKGIIGSESLCCSQIATFSPWPKCVRLWRDEGKTPGER